MLQRLCCLGLVLALAFPAAAFGQSLPAAVQVKETKIEMGENRVCYPQLTGMKNEAAQKKINDDIVTAGEITAHILTLSSLAGGSGNLAVTCQSYVSDVVFSTVISASGKLANGRNGQSNIALSYRLSDGERLTLDQLFTDPTQTVTQLENMAESSLLEEMSEYMESSQLRPLPTDSFYLDADGMTFFYPSAQFSYVSGYAGACHFFYDELGSFLLTAPDALPAQMGILPTEITDSAAKSLIESAAVQGALPGVPAALGQSMTELAEKYRLLRTPDVFPGGRYFVMEAPAFREILLISDAMENGYQRSVLQGIQQKRGCLANLRVGESRQEKWRKLLGTPTETIAFTESMAYDYNLPVGQSDVYRYGENELRLHADEEGILRCIQLSR